MKHRTHDIKELIFQFNSRNSRATFIYELFEQYFNNSVLDVGCFNAPLRSQLKGLSYTGIDIDGDPDLKINLEEQERLPFQDCSFELTICTEVLEHLNNLHSVFDELFRVTSKYLIISLPNSWCNARVKIERGNGDFLHYGLPTLKPLDRHKWFFNATHSIDFFCDAAPPGFRVKEIFAVEKNKFFLLKYFRKIRYPKMKYLNRYCHTVIALFERVNI